MAHRNRWFLPINKWWIFPWRTVSHNQRVYIYIYIYSRSPNSGSTNGEINITFSKSKSLHNFCRVNSSIFRSSPLLPTGISIGHRGAAGATAARRRPPRCWPRWPCRPAAAPGRRPPRPDSVAAEGSPSGIPSGYGGLMVV